MIKVLFICHGNICRSPMAEFILKQMVKEMGISDDFCIASAATSTEEIYNGIGNPVYPPARRELRKHGIDCGGKRAALVTYADYDNYDYLIAMDNNNLRNLQHIIGEDTKGKVSLLLDYTDCRGQSIADPWYSGDFEVTYRDIEKGCRGFLKYILEKSPVNII